MDRRSYRIVAAAPKKMAHVVDCFVRGAIDAHMPFGMGFGELVLILLIVVVVFGATKLPQLGDGLGKAIKNFKRSVGGQNELEVGPQAKGTPDKVTGEVPDDTGKGAK
jgi:sec-independent protein translocase protein TatA